MIIFYNKCLEMSMVNGIISEEELLKKDQEGISLFVNHRNVKTF